MLSWSDLAKEIDMRDVDTINVVTTMHRGGYDLYGRKMISSFLEHWPSNTTLTVYAEDFEVEESSKQLEVLDLHATCPELVSFKKATTLPWQKGLTGATEKARSKQSDTYNYKFDGLKFSNKVFAYCKQAERSDARYMVWIDADTLTLKPVPEDFIASLGGGFLQYLGRRYVHSECGFMRFDLNHPNALQFFRAMQAMYESGEIYTLNEWHDSFVFDTVRSVLSASGTIDAHSISSYDIQWHPFVNSVLGEYMDHLKGDRRKILGSSKALRQDRVSLSQKILKKLKLAKEA